jgi:hypothetical protein
MSRSGRILSIGFRIPIIAFIFPDLTRPLRQIYVWGKLDYMARCT